MFRSVPNAAEILQSLGGVGGILDALRRASAQQHQTQARHEQIQSRYKEIQDRIDARRGRGTHTQAQAQEVQWLIKYIYGVNARFFHTIIITDAEWTK